MQISDVEQLIKKLHAFQYDKLGIEYYKHPIWVKNQLPIWASDDLKAAALLHDSLEDTKITKDKLKDLGISKRTLEILNVITHSKSVKYDDYIEHIINTNDLDIIILKYIDMKHNLLESRLSLLNEKTRNRLLTKYVHNFEKLEKKLLQIEKEKEIFLEKFYSFCEDNVFECFENCYFQKLDCDECIYAGKCSYRIKDYLEIKYKNLDNNLDKVICKIYYISCLLDKTGISVCEYCDRFSPLYYTPESVGDACAYKFNCSVSWEDVIC